MNKRRFLLLATGIAVLLVCFFLRGPTRVEPGLAPATTQPTGGHDTVDTPAPEPKPQPLQAAGNMSENPQARFESMRQEMTNRALLWRTPLRYYGRVVDENGNPIAGARASYGGNALDETYTHETRNEGAVTTDTNGVFQIDGLRGIGLMVEVSHPDYYAYPENSTGFDVRSVPRSGYFSDSPERAEMFRMHNKGRPVPLVHHVDGVNVPLDGTPTALDLRATDYGQKIGRLVIQAYGTPPPRYNQQPFDWNVTVSVPAGGLIEYTDRFDFVAPEGGYQASAAFAYPKETAGWTDTVSKNFFVKLPSGYARLNIYLRAKRPLFFSIEYDYNADGSRNLERAK